MTDHTIEAHFKLSSDMIVGKSSPDNEKVIHAMASAIAGEHRAHHPAIILEAIKFYNAIKAMRAAEADGAS